MTTAEWFGLSVLSEIVITIAAYFYLPKFAEYVKNRGKSTHEKDLSRQKDEYKLVMYYSLHTDMLLAKMVNTLTWIMLYTLLLVLSISLRPILDDEGDILSKSYRFTAPHISHIVAMVIGHGIFLIVIAFFSMFGLMLIRQVKDINKLYWNVRFLTDYASSLPDALRDKEREEFVMVARMDRAVPGFNRTRNFIKKMIKKEKEAEELAASQGKAAQTPDTPSEPVE